MRKKRFLIPLIIILLILSTVIFIFFHNLNRFKDPNVVTPFIEQKLKIPVTIEKIDLNILGELQIKGLALYETEKKNSEEKIVFINKTIIKFNIAKILEKNFSGFISSIDIRKPEVFVNERTINWYNKRKTEKVEKIVETPPIRFKDGIVHINNNDIAHDLSDISCNLSCEDGIFTVKKISIKAFDGKISAEAKLDQNKENELSANLNINKVSVEQLINFLNKNAKISDLTSTANGSIDIFANKENLNIKFNISSDDLSIKEKKFTKAQIAGNFQDHNITFDKISIGDKEYSFDFSGSISLKTKEVNIKTSIKELPFKKINDMFTLTKEDVKGTVNGEIELSGFYDKSDKFNVKFNISSGNFSIKDKNLTKAQIAGNLKDQNIIFEKIIIGDKEHTLDLTGSVSLKTKAVNINTSIKEIPFKKINEMFAITKEEINAEINGDITLTGYYDKINNIAVKFSLWSKDLNLMKNSFTTAKTTGKYSDQTIVFEKITIGGNNYITNSSGTISIKNKTHAIISDINNVPMKLINDLLKFSKKAVQGNVTGKVSTTGTFDKPKVLFTGKYDNIVLEGIELDSGKIMINTSDNAVKGQLFPVNADKVIISVIKNANKDSSGGAIEKNIPSGWKNLKVNFYAEKSSLKASGNASHRDTGLASFDFTSKDNISQIDLNFERVKIKNLSLSTTKARINTQTGKITGTVNSPSGALEKNKFKDLKSDFTVINKKVDFKGNFKIFNTPADFSGSAFKESLNFLLTINNCDIKNLENFSSPDNNLIGKINIKVETTEDFENTLKINVNSNDLELNKNKIDSFTFNANNKGKKLLITDITVEYDNQKIILTGDLIPDKNIISLKSNVDNISLASLTKLFSNKKPDVDGIFQGNFSIKGNTKKPDIKYDGRILKLNFKGQELADGTLKLSGNPDSITGRLDMDKIPTTEIKRQEGSMNVSFYLAISGPLSKLVFTPVPIISNIKIDQSILKDTPLKDLPVNDLLKNIIR